MVSLVTRPRQWLSLVRERDLTLYFMPQNGFEPRTSEVRGTQCQADAFARQPQPTYETSPFCVDLLSSPLYKISLNPCRVSFSLFFCQDATEILRNAYACLPPIRSPNRKEAELVTSLDVEVGRCTLSGMLFLGSCNIVFGFQYPCEQDLFGSPADGCLLPPFHTVPEPRSPDEKTPPSKKSPSIISFSMSNLGNYEQFSRGITIRIYQFPKASSNFSPFKG